MQKNGKDWELVKQAIESRTVTQIRTHAQKFFIKLGKVVPPNMDPITFMKNNPTSFFVNFNNEDNGKDSIENAKPGIEGEQACKKAVDPVPILSIKNDQNGTAPPILDNPKAPPIKKRIKYICFFIV